MIIENLDFKGKKRQTRCATLPTYQKLIQRTEGTQRHTKGVQCDGQRQVSGIHPAAVSVVGIKFKTLTLIIKYKGHKIKELTQAPTDIKELAPTFTSLCAKLNRPFADNRTSN